MTGRRWPVPALAALLDVELDVPDDVPTSLRPVSLAVVEPLPDPLPDEVAVALRSPLPLNPDGSPDRSAGHHRVVAACVDAGMTPGQALTVTAAYPPSVEKYGARLAEQTAASWHKITADRAVGGWEMPAAAVPAFDSWMPVDLGPYLRGDIVRAVPSVGLLRSDGVHLIYPGKEHAVIGEMESGKSWFCAACAAAELLAGLTVVYVHFEEADPSDTVGRLQALGVPDAVITARFRFVGPEQPGGTVALSRLLDPAPSLVIFDGVNEAMSLHGWGVRDEDGAASFRRYLVKPCTAVGAATLSADHVAKDPERRGRTALGSVHKVNGLSGTLILLENAEPFGRGKRGRSHVHIGKDRPGHLRQHGHATTVPGRTYMGELIVDDTREFLSYLDLRFIAPPADDGTATSDAPSLADAVHAVISAQHEHTVSSERKLFALLRQAGHKAQEGRVRRAVDDLLAAGRVVEHIGARNAKGYRAVPTAAHDH